MLLHRLSLASRSLAAAPLVSRAFGSRPFTPATAHHEFSGALALCLRRAATRLVLPAASTLPAQRGLVSWARRPAGAPQAGADVRGLVGGLGGGLLRVPSGGGMAGGASRQPPVAWESVMRKRRSKMNKVRALKALFAMSICP